MEGSARQADTPLGSTVTPRARVERGSGTTDSERYLQRLGERSFLKFWSHPCVYQRPGRELCDLLIVFGNDVIIFSDKDCKFPDHADIKVAWCRWFKSSVMEAAKQIWGAERWIKTFPNRLYLDPKCTKPFPIPLPDLRTARFHRIVVAHGAAGACRSYFGGGSGSLMIDSTIVGPEHFNTSEPDYLPFKVGQIDLARGYVHIFDDTSLDIVMKTLDTTPDFVSYLAKKEALVAEKKAVFATGEEDLLPLYLRNMNPNGEHDFNVPKDCNAVLVDEVQWEEFRTHPRRLAQVEANRVSYLWDELIEKFSHHIMAGTQEFTNSSGPHESEISLRMLAKENRLRRRMLASGLLEVANKANGRQRFVRVYQGLKPEEPYYVLLALPSTHARTEADYREVRLNLLSAYCTICKHVNPDPLDIVGIAISPTSEDHCSEDLMYFDARSWTPEMAAEAESLQKDLGILQNLNRIHGTYSEYPEVPQQPLPVMPRRKVGRNDPCPCGSGRKFKKCHGR